MWSLTFVAAMWPREVKAHRWSRPSIVPCSGVPGKATAVLNLGGIANLSSIDADGSTIGFDSGPANALLDFWCAASTGRRFDAGGAWAAAGKVDVPLLDALLAEPYFALPPPKSTGRDLFNVQWLEARLLATGARPRLPAQDVQATLAELTARTAADAVRRHAPTAKELVVCGGGAFNVDLMARLGAHLAPVRWFRVRIAACHRMRWRPALSLGWLVPSSTASRETSQTVTGAMGPRILGALYPGPRKRPGREKAASRRLSLRTGWIRRKSSIRNRRSWSRWGS